VPTIYHRARFLMVGTLRYAHPTRLICLVRKRNLDAEQRQINTTANHFGFSEIVSSPGLKNIPLSFSPKSVAQLRPSHGR